MNEDDSIVSAVVRRRHAWPVIAHTLSWVTILILTAAASFMTLWATGTGLLWPMWATGLFFFVLFLLSVWAFRYFRPRGRVGALLSFLLVGSTLWTAVTGIGGYLVQGRVSSTSSIERVAASDVERELIRRAESVPCPLPRILQSGTNGTSLSNVDCVEGSEMIDRYVSNLRVLHEQSNRAAMTLRYTPRSVVGYQAWVRRGFPGTFAWGDIGVTSALPESALYWTADGTAMSFEQCAERLPEDGFVVGMLMTEDTFCGNLCGNGAAYERRVYFDAEHQPTCQTIYPHGQWIS
ncbi:MAG: hypothetical protein HY341_00510 [Candidatus Kerfeldbacteria bacterium]|nr:hypothetical protein [Candidatus Kerfeldbacteria bacterium]